MEGGRSIAKFCIKCGNSLKENHKFCIKCRAKIVTFLSDSTIQKSISTQTPSYLPVMKPKILQNKLFIRIIAIVVVIIIIIAVLLMVLEGENDNGGNDSAIDYRFIGQWKVYQSDQIFNYNSNGCYYTLTLGADTDFNYMGTFKVKGDQFCEWNKEFGEFFYRFEFSNDNKTLTLYDKYTSPDVLIKQDS